MRKRGYEAMLDYYFKVSPQFNEPLYLPAGRQVRDPPGPALSEVEGYSGVRGAPHRLKAVRPSLDWQ